MSAVLGSIQQIADHAYFYCSARKLLADSDRVTTTQMAQVDAALHDLTLCCGFPCDCETGTCEGLILS